MVLETAWYNPLLRCNGYHDGYHDGIADYTYNVWAKSGPIFSPHFGRFSPRQNLSDHRILSRISSPFPPALLDLSICT